jgi:pyruvate dehydrogenase E1 component beta subunit
VCEESARKTGRVLVVEEDCRFAGAGAEVAAGLTERCFDRLEAAPLRLGALDMPTPFNAGLEQASVPRAGDIVEAGLRLCRKEADAKRVSR